MAVNGKVASAIPVEGLLIPMANRLIPMANRLIPMANRLIPMANRLIPMANRLILLSDRLIPLEDLLLPLAASPGSAAAGDTLKMICEIAAPRVSSPGRGMGVTVFGGRL